MTEPSQQAVIDFLADPATHDDAQVTRIDTHAAAVFLTAARVLKIKRPVKFPFLDYTTLEKRKAACEAELEVNKLYAPQIYRGVVAITRASDGTLAIAGNGEPVEWAVEMERFDETQALDHLADAGGIDLTQADALGYTVAKAHAAVPVINDVGFAETLADIIEQNDGELRAASHLFDKHNVAALTAASRDALKRLRPLFVAREREGCVRRCHGDLHLGNIVLIDDAPVLFDAIEFNPKLATIDVFYDLAFLLMDLIQRDLTAQANAALNRYLAERNNDSDLDALAALPLLMSVRAAIRAKVTAARAKPDARTEETARNYFALAQRLMAPSEPMLVAVGGLSGTGKSVLACVLACVRAANMGPLPGAVFLRSDVLRKNLFGVAETERLPASAYTPEVTARVYAALANKAQRVLAAGHSAIVDAVFAKAGERDAIARAAAGAPFHGLFLTADLDTRMARVGARTGDASDADPKVAQAQEQYDLGTLDWHEVDASGRPEETLKRAVGALRLR